MSPYNLYKQKTSFTRSIRTLISTKRPLPKEYIQSSRLDQCALQASQSEQYVTMEIPSDLVANWKREGYTHLHLGGVRLILTLHGRKGLPVTARIALLDTRFKEYQHTVVGTVLTTLHAGSVLLTFYPNFNLSLEDPNLPTTLKVQIQLQGAEQTPTSKIATLHHQIVYRLQNHALDLPTPYTTSDALMILADIDTIPTIIQIPKQIQKQELLKLMPLEWLTNYEHFHQNSEPVQTTEATFNRRPNGQVKLSFQTPDTEPVSNSPQLSYTAMITAVQTGQEKKLPIHGFSSEGYPVYPDKINGHFLWDVPEAHMCNPDCPCLDDTDIDKELKIMRRKKKKKKKSSYPPSSCKSFPPHPPPDPKPPVHPIRSCLMFSSHSYEESFPPLEKQTDTQTRVTSKPFVQSLITASRQPEEPKQYEAVLNWQTKNANAQNHTLQQLGLMLKRLDLTPVSLPFFETYSPFYTPSRPQQPVYNQFFGFSHLQPTPQPSSPKKARSKVKIFEPRPKATSSSSTSTIPPEESPQDRPEPLKKDKGPMDQYHYHTVQTQSSDSSDSSEPETYNSCSSSSYDSLNASTDSESEYADITGILMATETANPSASTSTPIVDDNPPDQSSQTEPIPPLVDEHSTKPSSASWFTFDDIPRHKWAARLQEFAAWIDLQGTKPNAQPQAVLREFMACSTGSLRDWLESLGEYRQLQFMESPISTALILIHEQFIGEKTASTKADRKEYHQMKCCSLKRHLLDAHYKRMSILFYKLNGFNEPSLKHVFIASLPLELQPDLQRKLTATNRGIADISLGKIFQMAMLSLDKICEQKEFFKDLMEDKKPFSEACKKPYLKIECKDEKKCVCPTIKKRHFRKHFHRKSSSKKPFRYFKKKDVSQYRKKKSNRCFICKKCGHFARNCPHKPAKAVRLIQHLQHSSLLSENDDVESNFSEQSTQDDQTAFLIAESSDFEDISVISTVQTINHVSTIPRPSLKMSILPSKFHKPIPVIGFIDTGADTSMIDPSVLPSDIDHHKTAFCIPDAHYQWTVMPFGLKVAPSLFQKAMTKIFSPILHHELVYIDDILLFSSDHESHQKLLLDFFHIVQAHGIMLSEKKSSIGKESIDFLGMVIKDGQYQPGPHIAIELLKFPDTHLNRKQIQQFLGIVNYVCDFIPKVAIHTSQLSRMLKKQCPPWGPAQTEAVKQLKVIAQAPPPLRIPTSGQRILQTDANDDYWSAILLEDINGVRHFCAHASGQFKDSEKNYHVIYKEILAVKYGIKKFEFHLISHKFLINMDNSSFPRIFDFKNKLLPDKQLLSLKTWFAKYDFTVQHIKGNQNLIPDFLTRPAINKPALISSIQTIPVIAMNRQLPFKALNQRNFPMNISFQSAYQLQDFAKKFLYRPYFQHPETRDYWTQDMAHEWRTYPHPYTFIHDTSVTSVLKAYLIKLNNVPPPATDIHHTSIGPSHTLEIISKTQGCTPGSSSSPHGILVMEQRPNYTNVLFQDA
ncbi:hypothetical protein KPL70_017307 [Citrus sinensis]|nr:hypothetical protein KPL70_017307 [Citrus sinensis]